MTNTVIKVENLTKQYRILHENKDPYKKFSDTLIDFSKKCIMPWKFFSSKEVEMFKALNDVNFEIKKGEKIAIIGRNGAGKSTLLKVLSRITEPTEGSVKIKGRVASLLEVGTGFHPELTGRENIFLNGAILGMTKKEIQDKFDDIVEFSGCEKFLDTPVKRYSSGMRVRLGFAVAAHLESEILIVDEVLAVGDAEFQKKCLGKMDEISKGEGRTIIFVSHNMSAVQNLCDKGIVMNKGEVQFCGDILDAIKSYNSAGSSKDFYIRKDTGDISLLSVEDCVKKKSGDEVSFSLDFKNITGVSNLKVNFGLFDGTGECIVHYDSSSIDYQVPVVDEDDCFKINMLIDYFNLPASNYTMSMQVKDQVKGLIYWVDNISFVDISDQHLYTGKEAKININCKVEV